MEQIKNKMGVLKTFTFVFLCAMLTFLCVCCASAKTIYVPDNYSTIQDAVNASFPGDTIVVRDGTYVENVFVNIPYLTIKSENGSANCVVHSEYVYGGYGNAFTLNADGVKIEGFTITGYNGIYVYSDSNIISSNNISSNNWYGISLSDSSNNTISNNNISNNEFGISLGDSSENTISNNNISNNGCGIDLFSYSSKNIISDNNISNNLNGMHLYSYSSENTISDNNISNNGYGISLWRSSENTISDNNISSNNYMGISLSDSSNNTISNNNISNNEFGISLSNSSKNIISGNEFTNDGLFVHSYQNSVFDNTVNGRPLIYLEDESNRFVDYAAGQVILVNCNNITVKNQELTNTDVGIELFHSHNCLISENNISNNVDGIYLDDSSNNTISDNNISSNNWIGIYLWISSENTISDNNISNNDEVGIFLYDSSNNTISENNISSNKWYGIYPFSSSNNIVYLNNFNNSDNVYSYNSNNIWNTTEQITYVYKGVTYTNYMGNYWSDYKGSDADGDGIGDTPYSIDSDKDNYPLMERFENYPSLPATSIIKETGSHDIDLHRFSFTQDTSG
ncbi:MAG: hypothetical protein DRJ45_09000, partial [Thermoprotei archaeon]